MGEITTATGARAFIGPVLGQYATDSLAEFEAITGWVEIDLIESIGEFGDEAQIITYEQVGDDRVHKLKGEQDAGVLVIIAAHDPLDAGQEALRIAERGTDEYAIKIIIDDAPTILDPNSVYYFRGLLMGRQQRIGQNDSVIRQIYNIAINSEIFADQAEAIIVVPPSETALDFSDADNSMYLPLIEDI